MALDSSDDLAKAADTSTDEDLLADYRLGSVVALAAIVRRHEVRLARIAFRITGSTHEAEDIRSAVLLRLLQLMRENAPELANVGGWLTRCIVNEAITRVRSREREARVLSDVALQARTECSDRELNQVVADETSAGLSRALAQMTVDERALLSLRFDDDLTFRQMAEVLDRPTSTIKTQLSRIIHRLRQLLSPTS